MLGRISPFFTSSSFADPSCGRTWQKKNERKILRVRFSPDGLAFVRSVGEILYDEGTDMREEIFRFLEKGREGEEREREGALRLNRDALALKYWDGEDWSLLNAVTQRDLLDLFREKQNAVRFPRRPEGATGEGCEIHICVVAAEVRKQPPAPRSPPANSRLTRLPSTQTSTSSSVSDQSNGLRVCGADLHWTWRSGSVSLQEKKPLAVRTETDGAIRVVQDEGGQRGGVVDELCRIVVRIETTVGGCCEFEAFVVAVCGPGGSSVCLTEEGRSRGWRLSECPSSSAVEILPPLPGDVPACAQETENLPVGEPDEKILGTDEVREASGASALLQSQSEADKEMETGEESQSGALSEEEESSGIPLNFPTVQCDLCKVFPISDFRYKVSHCGDALGICGCIELFYCDVVLWEHKGEKLTRK
uniref:Uncharacterized protein n=1 Tax=Chromera velia CCMP2878 TaxID=1169474 RepID=A0A0G4GMR8_9ALVE|eukprot:Cvel_22599.t1-p1 / transcript=Cvel_22599.t1 / gene=Cvel_22599 / organism=Chromera_velia_CCMP2878 / gene_product=hypothetical protein / transcript_product=hypothetical protein / location=Cvel_scaffold2236:30073-31509(+) / protein_length=419 / sequence_SO=supercontig / SO=protein_coding / is_pseudo=false